jgi:hypothetical protein
MTEDGRPEQPSDARMLAARGFEPLGDPRRLWTRGPGLDTIQTMLQPAGRSSV